VENIDLLGDHVIVVAQLFQLKTTEPEVCIQPLEPLHHFAAKAHNPSGELLTKASELLGILLAETFDLPRSLTEMLVKIVEKPLVHSRPRQVGYFGPRQPSTHRSEMATPLMRRNGS